MRTRKVGGKSGKKDSDKGVDGVITFIDDASRKAKQILVQVKSGKAKSGDIRDFGRIDRQGAAMGVFITLENPSRDMLTKPPRLGGPQSKIRNPQSKAWQTSRICGIIWAKVYKAQKGIG